MSESPTSAVTSMRVIASAGAVPDELARVIGTFGVDVACVVGNHVASDSQHLAPPDLYIITGTDESLRSHLSFQNAAQMLVERDRENDHIPVMVLPSQSDTFDEDLFASLLNADLMSRSEDVDTLLLHARLMIKRSQRQRVTQDRNDALRKRARALEATVLAAAEPRDITQTLVQGLAEVFAVDRAIVLTFEETELPSVIASEPAVSPATDDLVRQSEPMLFTLASSLWESKKVLPVRTNHLTADCDDFAAAIAACELAEVSDAVFIPIGHNNRTIGLVWIASEAPRSWLSIELGILESLGLTTSVSLLHRSLVASTERAVRSSIRLVQAHREATATISHELRTPLTSVMGYLSLLSHDDSLPEHVKATIAVAERNATNLKVIVDQVVHASTERTADSDGPWAGVHLCRLATSIIDSLQVTARAKKVTLALTASENILIRANSVQLEQALVSILQNAINFTPAGGEISVLVEKTENGCQVAICDSGIGIPEDEVPHIFDEFYRASNTKLTGIGGMGLGLSLVRKVLTNHDASIDVRSKVGRGTVMVLRFPPDATPVVD